MTQTRIKHDLTVGAEPLLWCGLLAVGISTASSLWDSAFVLLLGILVCRACFLTRNTINLQEEESQRYPGSQLWRQPSKGKVISDPSGLYMSLLLAPLLCYAIGNFSNKEEKPLWQSYAMLIPLFSYFAWEFPTSDTTSYWKMLCLPFGMLLTTAMMTINYGISIFLPAGTCAGIWLSTFHAMKFDLATSFHGVFTRGEWMVVTSLASISLTQYFNTTRHLEHPTHATVAMAGLISVLMTCPIMEYIKERLSFPKITVRQHPHGKHMLQSEKDHEDWLTLLCQLPFWIGVPLAGVELLEFYLLRQLQPPTPQLLRFLNKIPILPTYCIPKSLQWLVGFLQETETPMIVTNTPLPQLPRYGWLLYWLAVLAVTIPFAPEPSDNNKHSQPAVVLMRKWFHGIAVLLFAPVTLAAPQLLALSYAIAWAILILLESARTSLPVITQFHERYLDPSKDGAQGLVISHMALIAGCALPLWISLLLPQGSLPTPLLALLQLWGVLSLGIGDAMGALIGVTMGRTKWSQHNSRTIEGSLAMWSSLMFCCGMLLWYIGGGATDMSSWPAVWGTVTFVTLLEAHTFQIDNLVLPLAGATSILLTATH